MGNNALANAAYSERYKNEYKKYEPLFSEENKKESENIILPYGYKIVKTDYNGKVNNCNLHGNSCILSDSTEEIIHRWVNFDDAANFEEIISHQNGNHYLIYRQELYGYTVFNLKDCNEFQYFPQCVLDGNEYFIWTNVYYNPLNNLLAVTGCIWGAPSSTLIVDFSDPMTEPKFQFDIIECLSGGYDVYDDADFVRWNKQNLVLNCYNVETKSKEELVISPEIYYQKINNL